jgi:hypothetical protein
LPVCGMLVLLPIVGVIIAADDLERYLEFPPPTQYISNRDFSGDFLGHRPVRCFGCRNLFCLATVAKSCWCLPIVI